MATICAARAKDDADEYHGGKAECRHGQQLPDCCPDPTQEQELVSSLQGHQDEGVDQG